MTDPREVVWNFVIDELEHEGYDVFRDDNWEEVRTWGDAEDHESSKAFSEIAQFLRSVQGDPLWHPNMWRHRTLTYDEAQAVRDLNGLASVEVVSSGFGISRNMVFSIWGGISFPETR